MYDEAISGRNSCRADHADDKNSPVNTKIQEEIHKEKEEVSSISTKIFAEISLLVRNLGIPAHIKGCRYIKYKYLMAMEDANSVNYIKITYPDIAKKCKTTIGSVERAIRHAIDIVWIRETNSCWAKFWNL
ncbi:MAG: sporulation initiation factor Spo0A C-terminal domain-containing protein [Anaerostipes hadrus]